MSNNKFGTKYGFLFFFLSIPVSLVMTFVVSLQLETLAENLSFDLWNFSFYVSLFFLVIAWIYYVAAIIRKNDQNKILIILFWVNMTFLNVCLFYFNYSGRVDGQLAFALLMYPFKTAVFYPIVGFVHDLILDKMEGN